MMESEQPQECSLDTQAFRRLRAQLLSADYTRPEAGADESQNDVDEEKDMDGQVVADAALQERASLPSTIMRLSAHERPQQHQHTTNNVSRGLFTRKEIEFAQDALTKGSAISSTSSEPPTPNRPHHVLDASSIAPPSQPSRFSHENAPSRHTLNPRRGAMDNLPTSVEPSDTQYLPSQVFTDHLIKTTFANVSRPLNPLPPAHGASDTDPKAYATGDSGHVNLSLDINTYTEDEEAGASSGDSEDELGRSQSQSQSRDEAVTSPAPLSPVTPAVTGQKRDRNGNAVVQSTPLGADGFAAMFKAPATKGTMGLSQVFKQTQAATSPLLDGPRSDSIFERPSPDARALNGRFSPDFSSPVFAKSDAQRAISDPREMYVPMKASQEVREKQRKEQLQARSASSPHSSGDEDELGEDSEERRAETRRRKLEIEADLRRELAEFASSSAPNRLDRRPKAADAMEPVETPANRPQDKRVICISDDTPQLPAPNGVEYEVSEDGSMGQYDELSQTEISGGPKQNKLTELDGVHTDNIHRPTSSPLPSHGEREATDSRLTRSFQGGPRDEWNQEPSSPDRLGPSQSVKVADSQPDKDNLQRRPVLSSSVGSKNFVSQSQGLTMSTNIFTDFPPQSEIPESSSIPHAPQIQLTSIGDNPDALVSESPSSSPPPTVETVPSGSPLAKNNQSAKSREDGEIQFGFAQDEHGQTPVPTIRKPVRTIIDTSPATAKDRPSSPYQPDNQDTDMAEAPSDKVAERSADKSSSAKSRSITAFETAPTHHAAISLRDTVPLDEPDHSPKVTRIRKMRSIDSSPVILDQPSPVNASFDVLNEEDRDYEAAISEQIQDEKNSPRSVTKSYSSRKALQEPAPEANVLPPREVVPASSPQPRHGQAPLNLGSNSLRQKSPKLLPRGKLKRPSRKAKKDHNKTSSQDVFTVFNSNSEATQRPVSAEAIGHELAALAPPESDPDDGSIDFSHKDANSESLCEAESVADGTEAAGQPATSIVEDNATLDTRRLFPNRVIARFKDVKNNYYSATCLGRNEPHGSLVVQYDDDSIDKDVSTTFVRSLELRPGDIVKIDRPKFRKHDYIIRELCNPLTNADANSAASHPTDVYGHQTLLVDVKQRESLMGNGDIAGPAPLEVNISEIYLTSSMWPSFVDRSYEYTKALDPRERLNTPSEIVSRPGTPSSRSRRLKKPALAASLSNVDSKTGLFANMAFAITYDLGVRGREQEKDSVSKMIAENGGRLLAGSFEELFERQSWLRNDGYEVNLALLPASAHLGFTALIADRYSRRVKFIQALALNIPCLSGRWIIDCVASRTVLPWTRYLLPAGESDLLGGSVRSRTFSENGQDPAEALMSTLNAMISSRPNLLSGASVVIVMGANEKKSKVERRERRELHVLLSCALGAKKVARVRDIAEARSIVQQDEGNWDFVNVDDETVDDANAAVLGDEAEATARSRKKRRSGADTAQALSGGGSSRVKVIGEEFIVQSLIAGALVDSACKAAKARFENL